MLGPAEMRRGPYCQSVCRCSVDIRFFATVALLVSAYLKERVPGNNGQETLQALTSRLNNLVGETVREDLARERGDVDTRGFTFENIPERFEIRVAPPNERVPEFESRDVCL